MPSQNKTSDVSAIRDRYNKVSEELIRLRAEKDGVDRSIKEKEKVMRDKYGVNTIDELRELAKSKASERNRILSQVEKSVSSAESVISEVRRNLKKIDDNGS